MKKKKEIRNWNQILSPLRAQELLERFRHLPIAILGDVGIDRYTIGEVDRISPEAPVPIVRVIEEKLKLGLASNVADNVRSLGGVPMLVGLVGTDRMADDFQALLKNQDISGEYLVEDDSRRTIMKERIVSDRQQLLRVDYESLHWIDSSVEKKVLQNLKTVLKKSKFLIFQDYAKGLLTQKMCKNSFKLTESMDVKVAVDPNSKTPLNQYKGAYVLTPNLKEAELLSGIKVGSQEDLARCGRKILSVTQAEYVILTLGKDGMSIFSKQQNEIARIPTYAREVYDVSGAGDTVVTVLSLSLASGAKIEEAAVLGNLAAGVVVGKRGTATVTREEILNYFQVTQVQNA